MLQGAKQLLPNCFPTASNNTGKKYSSNSKWSVWLVSPPRQIKHLLWSRHHQHTFLNPLLFLKEKKSLKFIGLGNVPYIQAGGMLYILIKRVNGKRSDNFHQKMVYWHLHFQNKVLPPLVRMVHLFFDVITLHTVLVLKLLKFLKSSFTKEDGQRAELLLNSFFCLQNARSVILGRQSLELFPGLWNAKQGQIYFWSELAYFSLWLSDYTLQPRSASMSGAHPLYFTLFLSLL